MDEILQTIQTYDKIAAEYCKKTRQKKFLEWEEEYIQRLLSLIPKSEPLILDAGCGDGRHCMLIDKNGGRTIGIDLSQNMLKEAKKLYPQGDFKIMDMRNLSFASGFFDGIWASGSIYHAPKSDIGKIIEEFKRVLKVEGIIGINFKLGKGEGMEANPRSYSGSPRYFAYYSKDEMTWIFESQGFEEIESCNYPEEIFGEKILQMWFKFKRK